MAKKSLRFKKADRPKMFGTGDQPYQRLPFKPAVLGRGKFCANWRKMERERGNKGSGGCRADKHTDETDPCGNNVRECTDTDF